jgi:hypothetical protein
LNLIKHQQQAVLVAKLSQRAQEGWRRDAHSAFALYRLNEYGRRSGTNCAFDCVEVAERHLVKTVDRRPEAFKIFLVTGGSDRRQCAAVEGAFEGNDAVALGFA